MATISCTKCDWEYSGKAVFGPRVLGAHMRRVHGVTGKSRSAEQRRSGLRDHTIAKHPSRWKFRKSKELEVVPVSKQKRQSSSSKSVSSLDEAIMVLQLEVDARLEVIARLKSMAEGK